MKKSALIVTPFPQRRSRSSSYLPIWVYFAAALVALVLVVLTLRAVYSSTEETVDTIVFDKERVCSGNVDGGTDCQYLVYTEAGTFKITDSTGLLGGPTRFSSADLYGRLDTDDCPATITYIGFRLPLFSQFPNIVSIEQERCS